VALAAFRVPERQAHVRGLGVRAGKKPQRVEARDRPHAESHREIRSTMAADAADLRVFGVMEAGQIGRRAGHESRELFVVKVARDAEAIVPFLGGETGQEERGGERTDDARRRDRSDDPE